MQTLCGRIGLFGLLSRKTSIIFIRVEAQSALEEVIVHAAVKRCTAALGDLATASTLQYRVLQLKRQHYRLPLLRCAD